MSETKRHEGRSAEELEGVTLLGNQNTTYKYDYTPEVLETFPNKHPEHDYLVTFDAYEFTSLCVTGDTMIDIATDETVNPDGVPIKDLVGTEGYVFCVDPETLQPLARKYSNVRKTRENVPVVKVIMDVLMRDKEHYNQHRTMTIKCTPDHPFLVRRGFKGSEWVKAKDLKPDMRLVASQRHGDCMRYDKPRHRLVAEAIFDEDLMQVHHIDHNHFNNTPDNLANLSNSEHHHLHRSQDYGYDESLDIDTLVALYEMGENFSSLAKKYNCDVSTIESRIGHLVNKRSQQESLQIQCDMKNFERDQEIMELYQKGYLLSEIADYMQIHSTTVSQAIKHRGGAIRESNYARYHRRTLDLPPLNHKVVAVVDAGCEDVYNMEVEDVENYFANEVIVHNCPKTGQPDFAKVVINYVPNEVMVESKSLKIYLFSFRSRGDFHEDCINTICNDLIALMDPKYIEVKGCFAPRGGIAIFPAVSWANPKFDYEDFRKQRMLDLVRDASNRTVRYDM